MKTFLVTLFVSATFALSATAEPPGNSNSNTRSRFYDFGDQVIDGQIRRPTGTYTNAREMAKFNRLLRIKKSFLPRLFATSKERVFK